MYSPGCAIGRMPVRAHSGVGRRHRDMPAAHSVLPGQSLRRSCATSLPARVRSYGAMGAPNAAHSFCSGDVSSWKYASMLSAPGANTSVLDKFTGHFVVLVHRFRRRFRRAGPLRTRPCNYRFPKSSRPASACHCFGCLRPPGPRGRGSCRGSSGSPASHSM